MPYNLIALPPVRVQSNTISTFLYLFTRTAYVFCLPVSISQKPDVPTATIFLPVGLLCRYFSTYVLPVLWIMSCLPTIGQPEAMIIACVLKTTHQRTSSGEVAVYSCLVHAESAVNQPAMQVKSIITLSKSYCYSSHQVWNFQRCWSAFNYTAAYCFFILLLLPFYILN